MDENMNYPTGSEKPTFRTTARMPLGSIIALVVILILAAGALNALSLTGENAVDLKSVLLCDAIGAAAGALLVWYGVRTNKWELTFVGDELTLYNVGRRKSYVNYDSPLSEMQMKLTSKEKNEGKLLITGTIFRIEGVQNFTEMQAFIEANYRKN